MENSRLITLLQSLDKKENRELRKFIESPFFNQRQDVVQLYDLLTEQFREGLPAPDKEQVFQHLYGKTEVYDDHKVRMVMSFLTKLTEHYLVYTSFFEDEVKVKTKLPAALRRRNLPKHYERAIREAKAVQERTPLSNAEFFNDEFHLQMEQYRSAAAKRTAGHNLQAVTDNLDIAYFARKLRQTCLLLSHQAVYKVEYRYGMLEAVITHVQENGLLEIPAIAVYYYCYHALTKPDEPAHFHQLKKLLVEEADKFPTHEIADLYLLAINFCIKRYNEGGQEYLADEFDLYKEGLKRAYFLNNGVLSRFTYRNIVTVGLVMKDFGWVEQFIHDFKEKLESPYRESMFSFNLARLEYERRNYAAALRLLQKSEYEDLLLNLAAKTVMLKIYYETEEFDALDAHLEAMRKFIRRKKIMGYHSTNYLNTIHFTKKLMEAEGLDKTALAALKTEIENTKAVAEKSWLVGRI